MLYLQRTSIVSNPCSVPSAPEMGIGLGKRSEREDVRGGKGLGDRKLSQTHKTRDA